MEITNVYTVSVNGEEYKKSMGSLRKTIQLWSSLQQCNEAKHDNYDDDQCLNVGSIEENSISEMAIMMADILSIDKKRIIFDTTKPKGVFRKSTDNSRFLALSNFKYTSFRKALEKTIEWFVDAYENHNETIRLYSKSKAKL